MMDKILRRKLGNASKGWSLSIALVAVCLAGTAVAAQLPQSLTYVYEGGTSPDPVKVTVESTQSSAIEARLPDLAMFWLGEFWTFKSGLFLVVR